MPTPVVAMLLGVVGLVLTMTLILVGAYDKGSDSRKFLDSQEGLTWLLALGVQGAVWAVVAGPILLGIVMWSRERRSRPEHHPVEVFGAAFAGAALVFGPALLAMVTGNRLASPVVGHHGKLLVLTTVGAVIAAGLFGHLAIVDLEARRLRRAARRHETVDNEQLAVYLRLRATLDGLLNLLAAMVTMAVLAAGLLMRALQAQRPILQPEQDAEYSPDLLWPYALYLVGALALAYVPTQTRLRAAGEEMRDARFPPKFPDDPDFEKSQKSRDAMDKLLGLHDGPGKQLKSALAIIAPLLGTFLSTIVGK